MTAGVLYQPLVTYECRWEYSIRSVHSFLGAAILAGSAIVADGGLSMPEETG
jgi:hypothetical protein